MAVKSGNGGAPDGENTAHVEDVLDLAGVLDAVDVPIVVIGLDCTIVSFNGAASTTFKLQSSDIGRRASEALTVLPDLDRCCTEVIATGLRDRREARMGDRFFLIRIAPFHATDRQIRGVVITLTNVTAFRASIEQAIYEREYTKAILNTIAEPLVVLDDTLKVQTANQAFYTMFGCSRAESADLPIFDLSRADWKTPALWDSLRSALSNDAYFDPVEIERDFPATGERTLLVDVRRLSRRGDTLLLLGFRDITESKKAQELTRQQMAQFETLLNQAPIGVYLVDFDFRIRHVNPAARDTFGDIPGGVVGRDFDEIIHVLWQKDLADELVKIFHHTLSTGEPYVAGESAAQRAGTGAVEYYEWRLDRILLSESRYGLVCYFRDIGERKRAEEVANRLAAIVESSDDAIVSKTLDGIIRTWNRGAERLFDYTADEAIGQSITIIIPPDRLDEEFDIVERLRQGERVESFETVRKRKDGTGLNISLTISPLRDVQGRVVGASKIARDITDRVRQEQSLQAAHADLQLANEDLQHFAHSASHDLQEPLRSVAIYCEMLQKRYSGTLGPDGQKYLDFAVEGVRRMEHLLKSLRVYMQVSTADRAPVSVTDANEALNDAVLNLKVAIEETSASVTSSELPHLSMQSGQLELVFQNLITNAIHYRSDLPPQIRVSAARQADSWVFSVKDNGVGIEP
ncbi:MAG TPA: PAS domain S-box protein, partial [Bryobacteraceae bacterium]|nr:PAS domain S-box protein [Bryobacteraceae bacterium]